ncbi:MAG: Fe-S cluster assembly ATPase SufC [Candidatus Aenigmarchaeota archaeon]|nr:Fe-S cluster assembly ATPase SufC [Candidatus Aenigmarchaeota archaeon]
MTYLEIKDLHASVDGKIILKGVNLTIKKGEIHALMGPNGSGKSTLSNVLLGHPRYKVESGEITFNGKNLLELKPYERAQLGMFLAFQYPMEIQGVSFAHFLFSAYRKFQSAPITPADFKKTLEEKLAVLDLDKSFVDRYLNVGFSGGEKKRAEVLQMMMFKPQIAILDETDSGLDIDSLKAVATAIKSMHNKDFGALVVTHYQRILNYLQPDYVHVMVDGKIAISGGKELASELEQKGYNWLQSNGN